MFDIPSLPPFSGLDRQVTHTFHLMFAYLQNMDRGLWTGLDLDREMSHAHAPWPRGGVMHFAHA